MSDNYPPGYPSEDEPFEDNDKTSPCCDAFITNLGFCSDCKEPI